eukprot:8074888-Pyramimonas_sp.AAC.1
MRTVLMLSVLTWTATPSQSHNAHPRVIQTIHTWSRGQISSEGQRGWQKNNYRLHVLIHGFGQQRRRKWRWAYRVANMGSDRWASQAMSRDPALTSHTARRSTGRPKR